MKAFILTAGQGNRLRPITQNMPKPLVQVAGVPLIEYSITLAKNAGCEAFMFNTHYLSNMLETYLKSHKQAGAMHISYEPVLQDTGGGLKKCETFFQDGTFFLANSDIITNVNIPDMLNYHKKTNSQATLLLIPQEKPMAPIAVNEHYQITDINNALQKNSGGCHTYAGVAFLEPEIFQFIPEGFVPLPYTGYTGLISAGYKVSAFIHSGIWLDCGNIPNYFQANLSIAQDRAYWNQFLQNTSCEVAHYVNSPPHANAVVPESVVIPPHCILQDSVVFSNAILQAGTYKNCVFHSKSVIKTGMP